MVQLAVRRPPPSSLPAWTPDAFEAALRAKERFYHIHHPFQVRMNAGQLTPDAVRGWVANRFYYQTSIPLKDAAIMANCRSREARRLWVQRIVDHDGTDDSDGGIEAWLQLGEAVGLDRNELEDERHVLPGVRFAVDAYVNFARAASFEEAACSSLTEMFAPTIHQKRLDNWPEVYPWIEPQGYRYFRQRLAQARRDVEHGLAVTLAHFQGRDAQEYALNILQFKLDVLWSMLDAMWLAYVADMPPFHGCAE